MDTGAIIGRLLGGRYTIASLVGTGSMSSVFRATQRGGPDVAVKMLRTHITDAQAASERLFREAQVIARLDHPGSVRMLDWGVDGGTPFVVLELVDGTALSGVLRRRGKLPEAEATAIIAEVCEVLEAAHVLGVVHRDLKPGNIMLLPAGPRGPHGLTVKVLDFGLARLAPRPGVDETQPKELTRPGSTLGTPSYMAPEQVRGANVDGRADVYSCGVILYEMLTATLPIIGENAIDTMMKQATEEPRSARLILPSLDHGLERTMMRCLAKNPNDRFQCAADLRAALLALGLSPATGASVTTRQRMFNPEETATALLPQKPIPKPSAPPKARRRKAKSVTKTDRVAPDVTAPTRAQAGGARSMGAPAMMEDRVPSSAPAEDSGPPSDSATQLRIAVDQDAETRRQKAKIVTPHVRILEAPSDFSDFEKTIPASRPDAAAKPKSSPPPPPRRAKKHDPEATIPAEKPEGPTSLHQMSDWQRTRPLDDITTPDEVLDTGTRTRVRIIAARAAGEALATNARTPIRLGGTGRTPVPPPRATMPTDPSSRRPSPRSVESNIALAQVLSGMPRDEKRWLIAAAIFGFAASVLLALWLLL